MDRREHQLQSKSICQRLFNFIRKIVASQADKTVNLGCPSNKGLTQIPEGRPYEAALSGAKVELDQGNASKNLDPCGPHDKELSPVQLNGDDNTSSPMIKDNSKDSYMDSGERPEEKAPLTTTAPEQKPIKKMVSINDVVEEISTPKKNKKMNKATNKLPSFEHEDDLKPVKSILKVGSKLNEKSAESL